MGILPKPLRRLRDKSDNDDIIDLDPRTVSVPDADDPDLRLVPAARLIAPSAFEVAKDHVVVGDEFGRTLYFEVLPQSADVNWLRPLFLFQEAIDVSMFITPIDASEWIEYLRGEIARDEAQIMNEEKTGVTPNFRLRRSYEENLQLVQAMENDVTQPFQVSVLISVRAKTLEQLDRITEAVIKRMTNVTMRKAVWRHKDGFLSVLPFGKNLLADVYSVKNIHRHGLQTMFPFSASDIAHERGILVGENMTTQSNVIVNRFMQPRVTNPGLALIGVSGSGKSYWSKSEMTQWAMLGVHQIVIDPQNEYERLCAALGGQFIRLGPDSPDRINPLDFSHAVSPDSNALAQKLAFLPEMFQVMLRAGRTDSPPLTPTQRTILDEALRLVYRRFGYDQNDVRGQLDATPDRMPVLSELHKVLERMSTATRDEMYRQEIIPLIAGLSRYVKTGGLASLFDRTTTADLRSHFVVINIQQLGDELLPIGMHLVLEFLRTTLFTAKQATSGQRRILCVDEAHRLMAFPETAAFLDFTARTARKFGVGLTVISTDVDSFARTSSGGENRYGLGVLQNCATTVLFRQNRNSLDGVRDVFKLSENETLFLSSAQNGEGLIFVDDERAWFSSQGIASARFHQLFTTTFDEVGQLHQQQARGQIGAGGGQ